MMGCPQGTIERGLEMKTPGKILILFFTAVLQLNAQMPSVQLKIKEKSGFFGMGGPRIVQIELSNQKHQLPATSDNINNDQYYYFFVSPAGDWVLDADFATNDLSKINIYQNGQTIPMAWKGEVNASDNGSIVLGFPKSLKLHQLFLFQIPVEENAKNQIEYKVPKEYWPGYSALLKNRKAGDSLMTALQYRAAITAYERILVDPGEKTFPEYNEIKDSRIKAFSELNTANQAAFESILANNDLTLKDKLLKVDSVRPLLKYVVDSLPNANFGIGSLDLNVAPILGKSMESVNRLIRVRDSLQHVLDDQNVRWIIEGSSTGKNGFLFQNMIETLANAFSSIPFDDTSATELKVRISDELNNRLIKNNIKESYLTFLRICSERYQAHMPIFPIDFLPNLKKDTAQTALPYYSMLKAVNDFCYGNYPVALEEIKKIFHSCYEQELNNRFDMMRIIITNRQQNISDDVYKMLQEAVQLEAKNDAAGAAERYRQTTLIAPNFAYSFFLFGKFYNRSGDFNRAVYYFQRAYQIDTLYFSAYRECFNAYLKQGNYKPMIDVLTTALSKGNDYWEINYNLGTAYFGDGDIAHAIQCFEHTLVLNPKSYTANVKLGMAYQTVKNFQKAREYFNNAIGVDPTRQEAVDYLTKLNEMQRSSK
jgi:tetratricopeptide (TPR) repeat protein